MDTLHVKSMIGHAARSTVITREAPRLTIRPTCPTTRRQAPGEMSQGCSSGRH
jgi:hypothetical protein